MFAHKKIVIPEKNIELFWNKVDKKSDDECWEWLGTKPGGAYGAITIERVSYKAHRVSWVLHNGEIPEGLLVCHTCDNPGCVNPTHLFLGTQKDNLEDMDKKGRRKYYNNETHPLCKLTDEEVREIRKLYEDTTMTHEDLGIKFGVTRSYIHEVLAGKKRKTGEEIAYKRKTILTGQQAKEIREKYNKLHIPMYKIAPEYGVSLGTIFNIIHNRVKVYDENNEEKHYAKQ